MARVEKTVFISYRRTNQAWALAVYQDLTQHGYDVFFDYAGIASGDFERVILENIRARAHFLLLLTPSALERCDDPGDWLRREIEEALATRRNIVPLMLEGFDFGAPALASRLTGPLAPLKSYNGLRVPAEYFAEAMARLRERYLNVPLEAVLHPASSGAREAARSQQAVADGAVPVKERELTAQEWFERGYSATEPAEQVRCYTEAIRLKPDYAEAYNNRGNTRADQGDVDGAIKDYTRSIELKNPELHLPYYNRGIARAAQGDLDGAIKDYDEALRLKPDYTTARNNRAALLAKMGKGSGKK